MTTRDIAAMIPPEYRQEILQTSMISRAQANQGDASMYHLFTVWKNYVEPNAHYDLSCGYCLQNILKNWKGIQADLIALERESKLLNSLT